MSQENSGAKSGVAAWYISRGGETGGPFATDMVASMLRDGRLQPLDLVYREGEIEWKPASVFPELKSVLPSESSSEFSVPRALPTMRQVSPVPSASSSNAAASQNSALSWIVLRPHRGTYLQEGPFETQAIIDGLQTGSFQFSQYAWHVGMNQWMRIGDLREFDRRARSRESRPHVPPPLPDPIEAVLLEDDKDLEAEEFHVSMKGAGKFDLTPSPLEGFTGFNTTASGTLGIGGAAAESPEEKKAQTKAGQAMALVVSPNLAGVPWEQDFTERYAVAPGLIDDEHSGVDLRPRNHSSENSPDHFTASNFTPTPAAPEIPLNKTPKPLIPPVPVKLSQDIWQQYGRYVAGGVLGIVAIVFIVHLLSHETEPAREVAKSADLPTAEAAPKAASKVATPVAASKIPDDPFGSMDETSGIVEAPSSGPVPQVSSALSVMGLKLDRPDGQILIQGQVPTGVPVEVSLKGRLGQVLGKMNVRKTVELSARAGEIPSLRLKELKLPEGAYTVEVVAGTERAKSEIFIGRRDARFLDRLETHLREVSLETQSQKKALFYASQELDSLARDLGQNYGELRGKPQMWSAFYTKWTQRIATTGRALAGLEKKKVEDRAYPEETAALVQAHSNLQKLAAQYREAIGQKRDLASDELTELIAELSRQKASIGEVTSRPTADTPDGLL